MPQYDAESQARPAEILAVTDPVEGALKCFAQTKGPKPNTVLLTGTNVFFDSNYGDRKKTGAKIGPPSVYCVDAAIATLKPERPWKVGRFGGDGVFPRAAGAATHLAPHVEDAGHLRIVPLHEVAA